MSLIFATMKRNRSVSAGRDGGTLQIQGTEALSWMGIAAAGRDGAAGGPAGREKNTVCGSQEERRTQCADRQEERRAQRAKVRKEGR